MNYQDVLNNIYAELSSKDLGGSVASYIPELQKVDSDGFGMYVSNIAGEDAFVGEYDHRFSIQSISKVLSLAMAFSIEGEQLWHRVGVEPSGNPFNSIVQLEYERGIPRNPFVNAGAIVVADVLVSHLNDPKIDYLDFVRKLSGNDHIVYNGDVASSEKDAGYLNAAVAHLLKSFDNLTNDVDEVLDFYFHLCSIEMSCKELSQTFLPFTENGIVFEYNGYQLTQSQVKRINALMLSCGFYDESGEFAFEVGLPGKSGVGGGIVAVHPQRYSIAVWSPRLNAKGNSAKGLKALEMFTTETGYSIF